MRAFALFFLLAAASALDLPSAYTANVDITFKDLFGQSSGKLLMISNSTMFYSSLSIPQRRFSLRNTYYNIQTEDTVVYNQNRGSDDNCETKTSDAASANLLAFIYQNAKPMNQQCNGAAGVLYSLPSHLDAVIGMADNGTVCMSKDLSMPLSATLVYTYARESITYNFVDFTTTAEGLQQQLVYPWICQMAFQGPQIPTHISFDYDLVFTDARGLYPVVTKSKHSMLSNSNGADVESVDKVLGFIGNLKATKYYTTKNDTTYNYNFGVCTMDRSFTPNPIVPIIYNRAKFFLSIDQSTDCTSDGQRGVTYVWANGSTVLDALIYEVCVNHDATVPLYAKYSLGQGLTWKITYKNIVVNPEEEVRIPATCTH